MPNEYNGPSEGLDPDQDFFNDKFEVNLSNNILQLKYLDNDLDLYVSPNILNSIKSFIEKSKVNEVIFDMDNVLYIDSSAIGMFISLKSALEKADAIFSLINLTNSVHKILTHVDLIHFLTKDDTENKDK